LSKTLSKVLKIEKLRKQIGEFTLAASFWIGEGERAALIGRSGSGKSTLLRLVAGLERCDEGSISLDGRDMTHETPQARSIGVVFQDPLLFPALTVLENATFGLRHRAPREEARTLGLDWLDRVGLKKLADEPVSRLSGGEAQRVAFVRGLIWKPSALLLDEPFSALDRSLREVLRNELLELHRLWPVPLLLVSHDPDDVEKLASLRLTLSEDPSTAVRSVGRS
jgi:ABC-type sulfate/molybdate transport systems ATPase subunit